MRGAAIAAVLVALHGCGHGEPLRPGDYGRDQPHSPVAPRRLTYNPGTDLSPSWLPDGSGIIYTAERLDRADDDWCLSILPPTGGRAVRTFCHDAAAAEESTNTFVSAAVAADGQLAYVRSSGRRGLLDATGIRARFRELVVGSLDGSGPARALTSVPYTIAGSRTHGGASQIRWLGTDALVYRGDFFGLVCLTQGPNCQPVTVQSGLGIVHQRLGAGAAAREVLPGTDYASSVAVDAGGDAIYYTLGGDSRVYRRTLPSGVTDVLHDFGAAGIARDVQVAGNRLMAVVGGVVWFFFYSSAGVYLQLDGGGDVHVVDLAGGTATVLNAGPSRFRHPALSPSGTRIVAESYDGRTADLFLFEVR